MKLWKAIFWINIISMIVVGIMDLGAGERLSSPNVFLVATSIFALYELTVTKTKDD